MHYFYSMRCIKKNSAMILTMSLSFYRTMKKWCLSKIKTFSSTLLHYTARNKRIKLQNRHWQLISCTLSS